MSTPRKGSNKNSNSNTMHRFLLATTASLCLFAVQIGRPSLYANAFVHPKLSTQTRFPTVGLKMSSEAATIPVVPNYNGVEVAKTGGQGATTASEQALAQNLSLGAPRGRPTGGHYLTRGGIQVTANVETLVFSQDVTQLMSSEAVIERLIQQLDSRKGVLLTSSYEFPGRYARWSLGFVDPPLEVSGKADKCTIRALNDRGRVLLPAIERAMMELKEQDILSDVSVFEDTASGDGTVPSMVKIDVTVVPPPEVGTFSEEDRSRQVSCTNRLVYCSAGLTMNLLSPLYPL